MLRFQFCFYFLSKKRNGNQTCFLWKNTQHFKMAFLCGKRQQRSDREENQRKSYGATTTKKLSFKVVVSLATIFLVQPTNQPVSQSASKPQNPHSAGDLLRSRELCLHFPWLVQWVQCWHLQCCMQHRQAAKKTKHKHVFSHTYMVGFPTCESLTSQFFSSSWFGPRQMLDGWHDCYQFFFCFFFFCDLNDIFFLQIVIHTTLMYSLVCSRLSS